MSSAPNRKRVEKSCTTDAPTRLHADGAGQRVAREHEAAVQAQLGFFGERFLRDQVQVIVGEAGPKLLPRIAGRELDVKAGSKRRVPETGMFLQEIPFQGQVEVPVTKGKPRQRGIRRVGDRKQLVVEADLNVPQ